MDCSEKYWEWFRSCDNKRESFTISLACSPGCEPFPFTAPVAPKHSSMIYIHITHLFICRMLKSNRRSLFLPWKIVTEKKSRKETTELNTKSVLVELTEIFAYSNERLLSTAKWCVVIETWGVAPRRRFIRSMFIRKHLSLSLPPSCIHIHSHFLCLTLCDMRLWMALWKS